MSFSWTTFTLPVWLYSVHSITSPTLVVEIIGFLTSVGGSGSSFGFSLSPFTITLLASNLAWVFLVIVPSSFFVLPNSLTLTLNVMLSTAPASIV